MFSPYQLMICCGGLAAAAAYMNKTRSIRHASLNRGYDTSIIPKKQVVIIPRERLSFKGGIVGSVMLTFLLERS